MSVKFNIIFSRLMEEEDKDAFQEEERAGESFLQPSSKSRFARSGALTIYTFHLFLPISQSQISQFCFLQVHPEEEKEETCWHGGQ